MTQTYLGIALTCDVVICGPNKKTKKPFPKDTLSNSSFVAFIEKFEMTMELHAVKNQRDFGTCSKMTP